MDLWQFIVTAYRDLFVWLVSPLRKLASKFGDWDKQHLYPTKEQIDNVPECCRTPNGIVVDQVSPFKVMFGFSLQLLLFCFVIWLFV